MKALKGSGLLVIVYLLLASILYASESTLPLGTSSTESTSPVNRDISVQLQEYIDLFKILATSDSAVNWPFLLRPVSKPTDPNQFTAAFTFIDSLPTRYSIVPDSARCELWPAWQLGICNLELAAGKYSEAVARHLSLLHEATSCLDNQDLWWALASNYCYQLRIHQQYRDLAQLLETIEMTFPSGPARQMRSELARLKYRLGTLEWSEAIRGTLGEARMGGIASHYRDFITEDGDTLSFLISKETVITLNGEVWVRWVGFTPKQDFESDFKGGDSFASTYLDPGRAAVLYLDSNGEVVLVEIIDNPTEE